MTDPGNRERPDAVRDQLLALVEKSQDAIVDAVRQWRQTGERLIPPTLQQLPETDLLPSAGEALRGQFELAEQLLAAQRRFAERLLDAARPPT